MKTKSTLLAAALVALLASSAAAQSSAHANGTATGAIEAPITLTADNSGLNFGNIIGHSAGTVTEAGGTNIFSNSNNDPGSNTGTVQDAVFTVSGQPGFYFCITTPATVNITNGVSTLTVNLTNLSPAMHNWNQLNIGTDDPEVGAGAGQYIFDIGGTLHVTATATTGVYTNTWTEQVAYQ